LTVDKIFDEACTQIANDLKRDLEQMVDIEELSKAIKCELQDNTVVIFKTEKEKL
jgi:hypothetical protein